MEKDWIAELVYTTVQTGRPGYRGLIHGIDERFISFQESPCRLWNPSSRLFSDYRRNFRWGRGARERILPLASIYYRGYEPLHLGLYFTELARMS